ncbi:MAG: GerMN domain-containing protein [Synechocystis sp.]|nr:GerMN domain-containing protein [Synechocystis sp.]
MRENKPFTALTWFAAFALFVSLAGAGIALWTSHNLSQQTQSGRESPTQPDVAQPGQAQVYWLDPTSDDPSAIAFAPRNLADPAQTPVVQLKQAFNTLLSESASQNNNTAIPANTRLLSLTQTPQGVTVDLSQDFTEGGGSSSMIARLGQIIYTASSLDPQQPVWLLVEGTPLTVLGGEGLILEQPLTRAQYEADFRGAGQ